MALIKWGMFITDGRGKVGGHVLTKTRHGATVRTKVVPTNPREPAQAAVRSKFGSLSSQWNGLTEAQRKSFNEAVDKFQKANVFGDLKLPTGRELFIRCNMGRLQLELAPILVAPLPVEFKPTGTTDISIDVTEESIKVGNFDTDVLTDFALQISATAPQSPGRYNFDGQYRVIEIDVNPTEKDPWTAYVGKFGTPSVGSAVGFRLALIHRATGLKGVEEDFRAIVEA